jgi:hypothetical protein
MGDWNYLFLAFIALGFIFLFIRWNVFILALFSENKKKIEHSANITCQYWKYVFGVLLLSGFTVIGMLYGYVGGIIGFLIGMAIYVSVYKISCTK